MPHNKAFMAPVTVLYQPGNPLVVADQMIVLDSSSNIVDDGLGNIFTQAQTNLQYNDNILAIKNRLIANVRDQYHDPTIQVIFLDGLGGLLNL